MNADVWNTIYASDVDGLRGLLDAEQASVYDVDIDGWTLLHVSAVLESHPSITEARVSMLAIGGFSNHQRLHLRWSGS